MNPKLKEHPVEERIKLVEDLWDSIAAEQEKLPLTAAQKTELDGDLGIPANVVLERIRRTL